MGCAEEQITEAPPAAPPAPTAALARIDLPILTLTTPFAKDAELRGLVTMAMVLGLSDIPGVVPVLESDAQPLAMAVARPLTKDHIRARFTGGGTPDALSLSLELCKDGGNCSTLTANGTRENPWPAIGELLDGVARVMAVPVSEPVRTAWRTPGSKDPYTELITGRACAVWLGLLPPSDKPGDKRADPIARALFLDARQPLAAWVYGLWLVGTTDTGGDAAVALQRAALSRPSSALLGADLAIVRGLQGRPQEAVLAWEDVMARSKDDLRYMKPYADALVAVGRAQDALSLLEKLPAGFEDDPLVAALRVQVADATGVTKGMDELLAHWQTVDPKNPEPVRRRVDLRVRAREYDDALRFMDALRARAPGPQIDALHMALLVAVGRPEEAAALAPPETAAWLLARAKREADPGAELDGLPDNDADALVARADAALWANDGKKALRWAEQAAALNPGSAEAEVMRAQAFELLGRRADAVIAWRRAWTLDPAVEGGPVETARVASTFRFAESVRPTTPTVAPKKKPKVAGPEL